MCLECDQAKTTMTNFKNINYHTDTRGVVTITLDRAEKHNAFNDQMIAELVAGFGQVNADPNARALVLAANGKSFCAGADLSWMQQMAEYSYQQNKQDADHLAAMFSTLYKMQIPTIARVQGSAYGGAIGLIACCDIAIANKMSNFCLSEVKIGLVPATISPYVINVMGAHIAKRYFMTAEVFSSRRARRLGLIAEAVSEDSLDETIDALLNNLLNNGPQAVKTAKALVADIANKSIDQSLIEQTSELIARTRVSPEGQEGLNAFLNKRLPSWRKE